MEISGFNSGLDADTLNSLRGRSSKSELMQVAAIAQNDSEEGLKLAAREFTGMFIGQMLKTMRSTVDTSEFMHGGEAEKIFQGLLDDEWARNIAYSEDIENDRNNITGKVYESLKRKSNAEAYSAYLRSSMGDTAVGLSSQRQ